jgi:hypothetical protein
MSDTSEIYYPYNSTFQFYGEPRAGKRGQQFVDRQNKMKGGMWELHTKAQYDEWYSKVGKPKEDAKYQIAWRRRLGRE